MLLSSVHPPKTSRRSLALTITLIPALLVLGFLIRLPLVWTD